MKTIFDENYLPNNNYFWCVWVVFVLERVISFHKGFSSLGIINAWDQTILCWGCRPVRSRTSGIRPGPHLLDTSRPFPAVTVRMSADIAKWEVGVQNHST